jgi:hypothetical protein
MNFYLHKKILCVFATLFMLVVMSGSLAAQGVTTASMSGIVTDANGNPLVGADVVAVHEPSGTRYGASTRDNGQFNIHNMRIGGPYTVTASFLGYKSQTVSDVMLYLAKNTDVNFTLAEDVVTGQEVTVVGEMDDVLNSGRTGAATFIDPDEVSQLPTIKRSTRDLTRLDPRSDGNFSFGGKNWLYNNISLDGSYFNNPFGLDDPAPGGQANAEPVPYEAVEQVQVSIAPFDVREGGFTGAGINTVTKSGSNNFEGSIYSFYRNEDMIGNEVSGQPVVANPSLSFNQSGFTVSGALIPNKLFFFINGELERREDPGTNFVASRNGSSGFGVSRVDAAIMDSIRQRMKNVYGYETGPYENYIHNTDNDKILFKLDWNINDNNSLTFRYNFLDARRDLGPHPFVLSFANSGRGPNETSLPFRNSGYRINNELNSFAMELNSRSQNWSNRFFASYNRFRDFREPFSEPFPTIEVGEGGVTYTTIGHEPFSIHNILDQDVLQLTNNFSMYKGNHVLTFGTNFEYFAFFNSFNIFRHGVFFLPWFVRPIGSTFSSLDEFFDATDPNSPNFINFRDMIGTGPFKGEEINVGQLAFYGQDEFFVNPKLNITYGLRVDIPMYFTDPVDNPFSRSLTALDENGNPETVDQSKLPGATPLFSPRVGFNYDVTGDRSTQLRGGTGIFTGRIPFVWLGNVISNPGANPNLYPGIPESEIPESHRTSDDAVLQQSFDLNAMDPDFKWPQVWTTNFAIDKQLGKGFLGTLEMIYSKDINAIFMRNADLIKPVGKLRDGRNFYGDPNGNELNPDGGAGIYVIDNTNDGYNYSISAQLRKQFDFGLNASFSYSFMQAKNLFRSTEIASVLWQGNPVSINPNKPELSYSEFGNRHRFVGGATYTKQWNTKNATHFGLVVEVAEGGRHTAGGGNRFSFIYSGDVNGDGQVNDLIYIPRNKDDIKLSANDENGNFYMSVDEQWAKLNAFIEQDKYLSKNRGKIADRFGLINEWFSNIDLRVLQDLSFDLGPKRHTVQISMDILNVANLINSDWGVRKIPNFSALSPLKVVGFENNEPVLNFIGPESTFIEDPSINSRWQVQVGLKYFFK